MLDVLILKWTVDTVFEQLLYKIGKQPHQLIPLTFVCFLLDWFIIYGMLMTKLLLPSNWVCCSVTCVWMLLKQTLICFIVVILLFLSHSNKCIHYLIAMRPFFKKKNRGSGKLPLLSTGAAINWQKIKVCWTKNMRHNFLKVTVSKALWTELS